MKLAVVTPIPTPYRDPFWNEVASRPGVELDVFYCAAGKADRPWQTNWDMAFLAKVLPGRNLLSWRGADASCCWNPTIQRELHYGNYDAIIAGGYNHPTMLAAMRYAFRKGIPYFLMCESYLLKSRSRVKKLVKDRLVRTILGRAAGAFPTGRLAEKYLLHYGASAESLTRIPNTPDISALERMPPERCLQLQNLRRANGLVDKHVTLFVGRLIPKKRAELLLRAFAAAELDDRHCLVIVGDGPERPRLEQCVRELGLGSRIRFMGFLQPDEVADWHALADLFVLPSSETWGVAVLEAVASGTPVIVSDEVGCHPDVVVDERLGAVVPARDEAALTAAIRTRAAQPQSHSLVRKAWDEIRTNFLYATLADRLLDSVASARTAATPALVGALP